MVNTEISYVILIILTTILMIYFIRISINIKIYIEYGIVTNSLQKWVERMEYLGKLILTIKQKQHREHRKPTEKQPITLLEQREEK